MSVVALLQTCDRELGNGIKGEASDTSDPLGCGRRLSGSVHSRLSPSGELEVARRQVKYRKDLALPIPWGPGRDHSPALPQKTRWSYLGSFSEGGNISSTYLFLPCLFF